MELTRTRPKTPNLWIVAAVAFASVADAVSTHSALARGGTEQNGFAADLFNTIGIVPVLVLRVVIPIGVAWMALRLAGRLHRRDRVIYLALCGALVFVSALWMLIAASNTFGWL